MANGRNGRKDGRRGTRLRTRASLRTQTRVRTLDRLLVRTGRRRDRTRPMAGWRLAGSGLGRGLGARRGRRGRGRRHGRSPRRRVDVTRMGSRLRPRGRRLLAGCHVHVPPDCVRRVGSPDWVQSGFGWVLRGCAIADRPLRRRPTILCWSRAGIAPALLACGWRIRGCGALGGALRRRRRLHRRALLPRAVACPVSRPRPAA